MRLYIEGSNRFPFWRPWWTWTLGMDSWRICILITWHGDIIIHIRRVKRRGGKEQKKHKKRYLFKCQNWREPFYVGSHKVTRNVYSTVHYVLIPPQPGAEPFSTLYPPFLIVSLYAPFHSSTLHPPYFHYAEESLSWLKCSRGHKVYIVILFLLS